MECKVDNKNELIVIGIDHGNKRMKASNELQFESGFTKFSVEPITKNNLLIYQGSYYTFGTNRFPVLRDKTLDDRFFILTLPMIGEELKYRYEEDKVFEVILSVGLPIKDYGSLKSRFKDYFIRDVKFNYKNREFNVSIKDVFVYPQGYAALMTVFNNFKDSTTILNIIDIGGFTIDLIQIEKGINIVKSYSIEKGIIRLLQDIKQEALKKIGVNITESQIESLLTNRELVFLDDEIKKMVIEKAKEFTNDILDEIKEYGFETRLNINIIIGGGALMLREFIENNERVGYTEFLDEFANSKGYKLLAKQQLKRR